ncbi:hypothetical protein VPH35_094190 [Triticum aestivum]
MEAINTDFSDSSRSQQLKDEDRLSMLTDDILLSILGRVSSCMAARTSVLSTRWKHLPWLLPELSIDVKDFLSAPCAEPIEENDMEQAMKSLTKATRSFLHLKLYLFNALLCEVGPLIGDAIDSGLLKDLDLTILDETEPLDHSEVEMQQRAQDIDAFFTAYPSFDKLDMHHVLFDCCKQLKHLTLHHCDTGSYSLFKIDAPHSKLCVLEIGKCRFLRIDLVCLPNLKKLVCDTWVSQCAPLTFGFVPSLGELELSCGSDCEQRGFKLSELLHGVTSIHTLTLDFQGETLWLHPEMEDLRTAFSKLRKLSVLGIFVEFDILWTTAFLVAAPSIEMLHIEVWEHTCDVGEARPASFHDRRSPQWEMHLDSSSENKLLKELEFAGFKSDLPTCKDEVQCDDCDALEVPRPSRFPRKKDEQEVVVKRIIDGIFSPEIIFHE